LQTDMDLEIIVVNDGSTDRTKEVLMKYFPTAVLATTKSSQKKTVAQVQRETED